MNILFLTGLLPTVLTFLMLFPKSIMTMALAKASSDSVIHIYWHLLERGAGSAISVLTSEWMLSILWCLVDYNPLVLPFILRFRETQLWQWLLWAGSCRLGLPPSILALSLPAFTISHLWGAVSPPLPFTFPLLISHCLFWNNFEFV